MMKIIFACLLCFCCSLSLGFVTQTLPTQSSSATRIRYENTRARVATTPLDGLLEEKKQQTKGRQQQNQKPKITSISSAEEYLNFLVEDERLCMVKFYASWCKSCQKFGMQYEKIGKDVGDDIRMAEVEYGANKELCKSLGIKKVPSVHFYSMGKKVDGFPCGPKKIPMLMEKLSHYRSLSLSELSFEADMNEGASLMGASVLGTLCSEEAEKNKTEAAQCLAFV